MEKDIAETAGVPSKSGTIDDYSRLGVSLDQKVLQDCRGLLFS